MTRDTDKRAVTRRRALQTGLAGLGIALAGCLGDDDSDDTEGGGSGIGGSGPVPDYATLIPVAVADETDEEFAFSIALDFEAFEEIFDEEADLDPGEEEDDFPEDPLLALPLSGVGLVVFFSLFALAPTGLDGLVSEDEQESFDSEVERMVFGGGGLVLTGEFVREEIDETLTTPPEDGFFAAEFEQVDERGSYEIYEQVQTDPDSDPNRIAVGETELFVGGDEAEEFETALDTAVGDEPPAHEQFDTFAWLLQTAGNGAMNFAMHTPEATVEELEEEDDEDDDPDEDLFDLDFDALRGATGFASALSFEEDGETVAATGGFTFEDLGDDERSDLEEILGAEGRDVSFEAEDDRVVVEATYDEETLE